jgi:transposase
VIRCWTRSGNEKGKVERAIRYARESFFEGSVFTTLSELNQRAWNWRDKVAHGAEAGRVLPWTAAVAAGER